MDPDELREVQRANRQSAKILGRVQTLADLLLRSQCLLEAFTAAMVVLAEDGLSDQQLAEQRLEDVMALRTSPPTRAGNFLFLHLATLYVVIEKWREGEFTDPKVDPLLESPLVDRLRQFRHGVFHGDSIGAARMIRLARNRDVIDWSKEVFAALHDALSDWNEDEDHKRLDEHLLRVGW